MTAESEAEIDDTDGSARMALAGYRRQDRPIARSGTGGYAAAEHSDPEARIIPLCAFIGEADVDQQAARIGG